CGDVSAFRFGWTGHGVRLGDIAAYLGAGVAAEPQEAGRAERTSLVGVDESVGHGGLCGCAVLRSGAARGCAWQLADGPAVAGADRIDVGGGDCGWAVGNAIAPVERVAPKETAGASC